ncbi:DUF421 domain-containing protein [Hymenobacter ginsengisoli]|uniref:DUF421 domain-containing protein n=1 Tax=Hymenobacter ginsengisoli TaxID=1051626 RepID=A0ABP8QJA9_9BACT|nr:MULTISPECIES: YetF domain-containing protein [unclassified Hymenobacter]MBO2030070.1 DUF421 domain-containing protein [Hymenobacter sp. BT559]
MTTTYLTLLAADIVPFDWQRLLLSDQAPASYLWEVAGRSVFAFVLTIAALRITGKRGVRQLSLFEFGLLLVLGAAAGDATFYHDVPLLYVLVVFVVVMALYVLSNYLIDKASRIEHLLEGVPELIVIEGEIDLPAFTKASLTAQELFGQLRQYQVEHLGQVRRLYLEATGEVSVYFFEPQAERPGLPIWPELYHQPLHELPAAGRYACHACATVRELPAGPAPAQCPRCQRPDGWLAACNTPRQA